MTTAPIHPALVLLLVLGCALILWLVNRCAQSRRARFQDRVVDPVFGHLEWQGYGDGDWWRGELVIEGAAVEFRIGGADRPAPALVARAHDLAASLAPFRRGLDQFLHDEAPRRPADAQAIRRLALSCVALFPGRTEDDPEGYSGEFAILEEQVRQEAPTAAHGEWRCDLRDGSFANLRRWS